LTIASDPTSPDAFPDTGVQSDRHFESVQMNLPSFSALSAYSVIPLPSTSTVWPSLSFFAVEMLAEDELEEPEDPEDPPSP